MNLELEEGVSPSILSLGWESHGRPNMGYVANCHFSCTIFLLRHERNRSDLKGRHWVYIRTQVPCVYSTSG